MSNPKSGDYREHAPEDWLEVTVTIDGVERQGELRAWHKRDGVWWGNVRHPKGDGQNTANWYPADLIREGWDNVPGPLLLGEQLAPGRGDEEQP